MRYLLTSQRRTLFARSNAFHFTVSGSERTYTFRVLDAASFSFVRTNVSIKKFLVSLLPLKPRQEINREQRFRNNIYLFAKSFSFLMKCGRKMLVYQRKSLLTSYRLHCLARFPYWCLHWSSALNVSPGYVVGRGILLSFSVSLKHQLLDFLKLGQV